MKRRGWMVWLMIGCLASPVWAQEAIETPSPAAPIGITGAGEPARFSADTGTPLIGQSIHLKLTVEVPPGSADSVIWPDIPTDWPPFWVTDVGDVVEYDAGNMLILERTITVTLWDIGEFQTPETYVTYRLGSGETARVRVRDLLFTVTGTLGADLELHPLKPQLHVPYLSPWITLIGGFGVSAVITGLVWWWRRGLRFRGGSGDSATPAGRALLELDALARQDLPPAQLFPLVANCLRDYLQGRFDLQAQDMTTHEVIVALHSQGYLPERPQKELQRILEYADLVKFANFQPGKESARQLLLVARGWLDRAEAVAPVLRVGEQAE